MKKNLLTDLEDENSINTTRHESYKRIDISSDEEIAKMLTDCDDDQKIVIDIAVTYSRSWKKSQKGLSKPNDAPLLIVQGGAGSGKSRLINLISQLMEKDFRSAGDDINSPYIIISAFTGTAAANVNGQTLHSVFSFNFGKEFLSLSDKKRDQKRKELQNLKVLIIDEISMVDSDMLYKINLRLQEIMQNDLKPFGGIAVFVFGDLMQLKPVRANYIFQTPRNENFVIPFKVDSLWNKFMSVTLTKNHRQANDKDYADILNRIRVGKLQEHDIQELKT